MRKTTLRLTREHAKKRISVTVKVSKKGYATKTTTSKRTVAVRR